MRAGTMQIPGNVDDSSAFGKKVTRVSVEPTQVIQIKNNLHPSCKLLQAGEM